MDNNIYGKIDFAASLATLDASNDASIANLTTNNRHYTILLYGSVFNTDDLKKELKKLGVKTDDLSTAKIILTLFAKHDKAVLDMLIGMYSIAIYESKNKRLFLARDRVGSRSLLYTLQNNVLTFASDYSTLFKDKSIKPILTVESLKHIFLLGPAHSPTDGVFKNIQALAAGHYLEFTPKGIVILPYWKLKTKDEVISAKTAVDKTRDLITECTNQTLTTDTPPAIFLSGGLDSGIVAAVASSKYNKTGQQLHTYSIDFEESSKDFLQNSFQPTLDKDFIGTMVERIGSVQKDIVLTNLSLGQALNDAAIARGLPGMADVDSSLLLFCREVAKENSTALSGECADEIFGGYPWYHNKELRDFDGFPWSRSIEMRCRLLKNCQLDKAKEFANSYYKDTIKDIEYHSNEDAIDKRIRQLFVLNLNWFGATLLERKERMSVAAGITVRMPFTDHRLVEWAYNLPWCYKALNGREKGIMREAFKDILPSAIINRKKSPFPKTYSPVYLAYVKNTLADIINSGSAINQIIDIEYLSTLLTLDPNDVSIDPWYGQLMRLPQIFAFIIQLDTIIKEFGVTIE